MSKCIDMKKAIKRIKASYFNINYRLNQRTLPVVTDRNRISAIILVSAKTETLTKLLFIYEKAINKL